MEKFRWCFIGTGRLAYKVGELILASGKHEIVSAYSRRAESCDEFCEKFGAAACKSAAEAISRDDVDGVYVVTPHNSHYEYAKLAMELGKPVLCEKAFTLSVPAAKALMEIAGEKNVYITEAMWTWYGENGYKVIEWLPEIGDIQSVELTYRCSFPAGRERVTNIALGAGALLDIGVYPVTYLYRLFGYPEKIDCVGDVRDGIDYGEEIDFTFTGGIKAHVSVSMDEENEDEHMEIMGSLGRIHSKVYHKEDPVILERVDGTSETFTGSAGYVREFDCVADDMRKGLKESALVPHKATLDVMEIMCQCLQQMGVVYPEDIV